MDYGRLLALAKPYLDKNDLGAAHTSRVLSLARENFPIPAELEDITVCSIILHDIGGSSIKDQYEKGPKNAASILQQMGCREGFTNKICLIVGTHHDHPDNPSVPFRILYDSDRLVMFSPQEFPMYDKRPGFDWDKIIDLIYSDKGKRLAVETLRQRRKEKGR